MDRVFRSLIRTAFAAAFAAVVLISGNAHAQTIFQPLGSPNTKSVTLPAGTTPQGVAVADFNHDGFPDMVVANKADVSLGTTGTISVYLSSGPGTFLAPVKYPTCGGPTAVLAKDLDLTGLQDIVITCNTPTSNVIEVFLNLGNGTFNPVVDGVTNIVLGTGAGPVAITSGDFNSDGHPDLAVADSGDGTVTLFLSNASNNFTSYTVDTLSGLGTPTGITAKKFKGSGFVDLAVTDSSANVVHILTGDGHGGFTAAGTVATGAGPNGITAGDFNHDGFLDLAVVNATDGTVSILLGHGDDTFTLSRTIRVGPGGKSPATGASAIIAFDINGDGYLDLATANTLQGQVAVLMNRGNGNFNKADYYAVPNGPAYLAKGDFNRDGKPDLAVTQSTGSAVSVLINNTLPTPVPGGRSFLAPTLLPKGNGNMADAVAVGDFNHDGFLDIATAYLEDNVVKVQLATGKGKNFRTSVAMYPVGKQPYSLVAKDLNNDGYADLVAANTTDGSVSVLMNKADGSGTFSPAITLAGVGRLPYGVAAGDLNGDGFADIVVANYGDNALTVLYGPFDQPFQTMQSLPTCTNPYGVVIGDFRHTGQNDIAVTCYASNEMEVFLNNGMLPFQPPQTPTTFQAGALYPTDTKPTSIVMGDFNRDGNMDIVTGNSVANDVSFFAGNGNGTFGAAVNSFALNFPDSIAAGDVNGDGILDIAAVAPNFNQVSILLGKGDGSFQPRLDFAAGTQPWAVALGDFNKDGKQDFITANTYNRVNLTIPAYIYQYMTQFPPVPNGHPSVYVALNSSGTNIAFSASPSATVPFGTPVTLTATVTPSTASTTTPTGTVIFQDSDGTSSGAIPLTNGSASLTTSTLGTGTHQITVLYSGDASYQPNTATGPTFVVTVTGTPVSLSVPSTISPTTTTSYTVMVGKAKSGAANPVGTITLFGILPNGNTVTADGPHPIGTAGTGGTSTFTGTVAAGIPPGTYFVYAVFQPAGGSSYAPGSSVHVQVVSQ